MRPHPRLREEEQVWEVEREKKGRLCCNPYYMTAKARGLFKKLFVVLFLKESCGDGMKAVSPIM